MNTGIHFRMIWRRPGEMPSPSIRREKEDGTDRGNHRKAKHPEIQRRSYPRRNAPDDIPIRPAGRRPGATTQPWTFYVLSGQTLAAYKTCVAERMAKVEAHASDIPMPEIWPEPFKSRYSETGKLVLSSLSISREDKASRNQFYEDMAGFSALHALLSAVFPGTSVSNTPCWTWASYPDALPYRLESRRRLVHHGRFRGLCVALAIRLPPFRRQTDRHRHRFRVFRTKNTPINRFSRLRMEMADFVTWVASRISDG